jgi:hypothetical protein
MFEKILIAKRGNQPRSMRSPAERSDAGNGAASTGDEPGVGPAALGRATQE